MVKEFMGGKRFGSDEELENAVTTGLNEMATEEYDMGILKLVDRYDKCLNVGGSTFSQLAKLFPIGPAQAALIHEQIEL
ncbi:hypothetical protein AVEN_34448-1 [Araneus ventricosus]|uniref:Uncharacterized protein n=1 Tax=Araneus ventricosus TaxID=182803 RepID=A0A4Y2IIT6_ARAVE|nr:hypothetical protein AVEN_34448-1 [Araneus ventricosus]